MDTAAAPDDLVSTHEQAAKLKRPPLLVLDPLRAFLDDAGLGAGGLHASPIGDGHSNVTYLIEREDGSEMILRRPPRGPLQPSAHDVLREARLLRALQDTAARVPRVLALCADEQVIGRPFYVMERVHGEVILSELPPALNVPEQRRAIGEELVDALVEIHDVDWRAAGLQGFGKETGYLERQLRRFEGLWQLNKTRDIPEVDRVLGWLTANRPRGPEEATIVHGDYRLGNTIFCAQAPSHLVAVLDWELATIGDPLADVGYLCMMWSEPGDPSSALHEHLANMTRAGGFSTRAELVARYEERSGRSMVNMRWYTVLALFRTAVFVEGNYKRGISGLSDDPYVEQFGEGVVQLAKQAERLTRED